MGNALHLHEADDLRLLVAELLQRVRRLEAGERVSQPSPPGAAGPLSVRELCTVLGMAPRTFYRVWPELQRLGVRELPRLTRGRRFDRASVWRVCGIGHAARIGMRSAQGKGMSLR